MIVPPTSVRVFVATKPVDFRKGMDGLAAIVEGELKLAQRIAGLTNFFRLAIEAPLLWPSVRDGFATPLTSHAK